MPDKSTLVVAVDGGQTSTLAIVATPGGRILGAGLAGPSNHVHQPGGLARLESALRQSIGGALQTAGCTADQVTYVCLGMTGAVKEAVPIAAQILPAARIQVYYDMVTALAGASIAQPGVVVIGGTGSIAYGRLDDGRDARAGGWGYLIGDEGSAYSIGRAALQAASQAVDRRGAATLLTQSVPAYFKLTTIQEVRDIVYTSAVSRPQIAGLAAIVTKAAQEGDTVALGLLTQAGRDLAETAVAVMRQLNTLEVGMNVFTTGGVFKAGALVLAPFRDTLLARSGESSVNEAAFSPIVGALLLALRAAGSAFDANLLQSIQESLPAAALSKISDDSGE